VTAHHQSSLYVNSQPSSTRRFDRHFHAPTQYSPRILSHFADGRKSPRSRSHRGRRESSWWMAVDRRGGGVGSSGETGDRAADAGRFGWTAVKRRPSTRCSANGASKPTLRAERVSSVGSAGGQSRPPITHPLLSQPQRHPLSHHSQPHSSPTLLTPALYEKPRRSRTVVVSHLLDKSDEPRC
jgi:hypothetical protein